MKLQVHQSKTIDSQLFQLWDSDGGKISVLLISSLFGGVLWLEPLKALVFRRQMWKKLHGNPRRYKTKVAHGLQTVKWRLRGWIQQMNQPNRLQMVKLSICEMMTGMIL